MAAADSHDRRIAEQALTGKGSHVETVSALEGLDWRLAGERPPALAHSIFQVVNHMCFWQQFALDWLEGEKPPTPARAAASWPGEIAPVSERQWEEAAARLRDGLGALRRRAAAPGLTSAVGEKTAGEILHLIATHNSYHLGQLVTLRQLVGSWPPPGGGYTW